MTPQALKASILQLAIQGKLVPQRPEEGTAEELYQQIQAEKQRLIAEGKIKKEKPLPPIEESEIPFEIPETWKWVKMGEMAWFLDAGKSPKCEKKPAVGNEWGVITTTAIQENYFDQTQNKVLPPKFTFSPSMQIRVNDILITRAGPTNRTGIACLAEKVTSNLILSDKTVRIHMSYAYAHRAFIVFALNSPPIRQQIIGKMSGMDKQQVNVSQDKMCELLIPLPPLSEQQRIVSKVEEMLPLVERYGEAYEQLQAFNKRFPDDLRKSILQEAIQGKLVPQRPEEGTAEELYQQIQTEKKRLIAEGKIKKEKPLPPIEEKDIPFDIPETWKWVYIGEIFAHNTGKAQNASAETKNGVLRKFITTSNLYWDSFDFTTVKEMLFSESELAKCSVQKGDLLVCEGGDVGRSAIWPFEESMCIQNHIHKLRAYVEIEPRFFYYVLYLWKNTGNLSGRGVGIKGLSSGVLHTILCPLPPLGEQKRVVAKIEEMLEHCESMQS